MLTHHHWSASWVRATDAFKFHWYGAGYSATNAYQSNFIGQAGQGATGANFQISWV
jgi:hypothetical protein